MIHRSATAGTLALLTFAACRPDAVPTRPRDATGPQFDITAGCPGNQKPGGSSEGEVFGSIYEDGRRTCRTWFVNLSPSSDAQSRLHMPSYNEELVADWHYANMFEWWEPSAGYPCGGAGQTPTDFQQNGSPFAEVVHAPANPKEGHCVRPGRYGFSGPEGYSFPVDYIQWSGRTVTNTGTGAPEYPESAVYDPNTMSNWQDLIINIDITTVHPGDSPVLEIQNSGSDPYLSTFADQATPSGTAADWFRFSVMRSTSNWAVDLRGRALARLYFDGTDASQATGYYSYIPEGNPVLRLHRFPNPSTASKQYSVGLELMRPDELPSGPTITRTVMINRINPDLAVGTISAPANGSPGYAISITIPERNLGTDTFAPVESGWTGKVYLSTDAILSPVTDRLIDTYVEASPIAAGQTLNVPRSPTVPADLPVGTYYVLASLDANGTVLESNESNNVGVSNAVGIYPPVVACATFEGTTTWLMTDQIYSAATCSTQGPNIRYRWQTDAGGAWTAYSTSPTYEFSGYGTIGNHTVTLEVKDVSTGVTATDVKTISVQNGIVTVTGQTEITIKQKYFYHSNVLSNWWERILPASNWTGPIGPDTTWSRIWSGGCYTVDVRADASGGGVLKRGRLQVEVMIGGC